MEHAVRDGLLSTNPARTGEVSGVRVKDIDLSHWIWAVRRRQTTPFPGGLAVMPEVRQMVAQLGYGHLRRHDLRYTGLTWMADAGVSLHVLRSIALAGAALSAHLSGSKVNSPSTPAGPKMVPRSGPGPRLRIVR